jgi:hypothetical protein
LALLFFWRTTPHNQRFRRASNTYLTSNIRGAHSVLHQQRERTELKMLLIQVISLGFLVMCSTPTVYFHHSVIILTVLSLPSTEANQPIVHPQFGTIMNYQGRVNFNAKPYLAIQQINISKILRNHEQYLRSHALYQARLATIDLDLSQSSPAQIRNVTSDPKHIKDMEWYQDNYIYKHHWPGQKGNSHFLNQSIILFKDTSRSEHNQYIQQWDTLMSYVNSTFGKFTDINREKRFLLPLLGIILPIAKIIGISTLEVVANKVSHSLKEQGPLNLTRNLRALGTNVVEVKETYMDIPSQSKVNFDWSDTTMAFFAHQQQIPTLPMAQREQGTRIYQLVEQESNYMSTLRSKMSTDLISLHNALIQLSKGTLSPFLVPYPVMDSIVNQISKAVKADELALHLPSSTDRTPELYQYVTPFLLTDRTTLFLFMIFPLYERSSMMDLYSVHTYPFLTSEGAPVELMVEHKFFAKSIDNQHTTTFDENTLDNCATVNSLRFCRSPRPLKRSQNDCLTNLHAGKLKQRHVQQFCSFKTVPVKVPRFEFIVPNTYAYYLPTPMDLRVTCVQVGPDKPYDIPLNRTGVFAYNTKCHAEVADYLFPDTTMETLTTNYSVPGAIPSFAEFLQYSADGDINNDAVLRQLVLTSMQNNTQPQSMQTLISTSKISMLRKAQEKVQATIDFDLPNRFLNFIAGVLTLIFTHLAVSLCYCRRRCAKATGFNQEYTYENELARFDQPGQTSFDDNDPTAPINTFDQSQTIRRASAPRLDQLASSHQMLSGDEPFDHSTLRRQQSFVDNTGLVYKVVNDSPLVHPF